MFNSLRTSFKGSSSPINNSQDNGGEGNQPVPVARTNNLKNAPSLPSKFRQNLTSSSEKHDVDGEMEETESDTEIGGEVTPQQSRQSAMLEHYFPKDIDEGDDKFGDLEEETSTDTVGVENRPQPSRLELMMKTYLPIDRTPDVDVFDVEEFEVDDVPVHQQVQTGGQINAKTLGEIENGIQVEDKELAAGGGEKSVLDKIKDKLSGIFSRLKSGFESFAFALKDKLNPTDIKNPSQDSVEAKLDRRHAFMDKSKAPAINVRDPNGLEAFTSLKWTGDTDKDNKTFARISNQLTGIEGRIRLDQDNAKESMTRWKKELKDAMEERVELAKDVQKWQKIKDSQTALHNIERTEISLEARKKKLDICEKKIAQLNNDIDTTDLASFEPANARVNIARSFVRNSSQLHLSELSKGDLELLASKFEKAGHPSKATFVRAMADELGRRPVTASQQELSAMRQERDEELRANFTPTVNFESSTVISDLTRDKDNTSLNMRKMLKDLHRAHADPIKNPENKPFEIFVDGELDRIIATSRVDAMRGFDATAMKEIASKLKADGHDDRSKLLNDIIAKFEYSKTDEGQRKIYLRQAELGLATVTDSGTFARNSGESLSVAVGSLMESSGMPTFEKQVRELAQQFCKDLKNDKEIISLKQDLANAKVTQLKSAGMTPELANRIGAVAIKFQTELFKLVVPEGVNKMVNQLAGHLIKRPTVEEGTDPSLVGNGLTEKQKNSFVHKLFSDQLFLKAVTPAMTVGIQSSEDPEVNSMRSIMVIAAAIIMRSANQIGLHERDNVGDSAALMNELIPVGISLMDMQDEFFVKNGMRIEAKTRNNMVLPEIKPEDKEPVKEPPVSKDVN